MRIRHGDFYHRSCTCERQLAELSEVSQLVVNLKNRLTMVTAKTAASSGSTTSSSLSSSAIPAFHPLRRLLPRSEDAVVAPP